MPPWLSALYPFERRMVDVGGRWMHVATAGEGAPVLLLHGNPTWSFLWRGVMNALRAEELRLIVPDLVGFGCSEKPRESRQHTLERHAAWIAGLLDGLAVEGVTFVGHDWGGPIGLLALAARPGRLAGLVLTNTVTGPPRPGSRPTAFHRFANLPLLSTIAFRLLGYPQRALDRAQGDRRSIRGDVARAYRWPLRRLENNIAPLALARMVPVGPEHPSLEPLARVQELVESYRGPAAIVWGDRDPVIGRAFSRVARGLPQAMVTHTEGGHFLQEEVPEAIAAAVVEVARRV